MKKRTSNRLRLFDLILFLIVILLWKQEFILGLSIAIVIAFVYGFGKIRNHRLLKTVTRSERGTKSERDLVLKLLKHGISSENIFHDLYLEKRNGEFSQIDLVVLASVGVIVFEVKDFSGWIYGNGNHSYWTKVMAYGKSKYRFYNPIKQNSKHIQDLRSQINYLNHLPFYSVVVFYGDCVLKEVDFVPKETYLVKQKRVLEVMKLIEKENAPVFYNNKIEIIGALKKAVLNGENMKIRKQHIENINGMLGKDRVFD